MVVVVVCVCVCGGGGALLAADGRVGGLLHLIAVDD